MKYSPLKQTARRLSQLLLSLSLTGATAVSALANVEPVIISLTPTPDSFEDGDDDPAVFEVPAGRVFILDSFLWDLNVFTVDPPASVFVLESALSRVQGNKDETPEFFSTDVVVDANTVVDARLITLPRPMFIPGGSRIRIPIQPRVTTDRMLFFGRLADDSDIFAQIPAEFENVQREGGVLQGDLILDTARPAIVRVETSDDLESFAEVENVAVEQSAALVQVAVDDLDSERLFMRATAFARPSQN